MGWGYTCFVSAFAIFVSEREINTATSGVLKAFSAISNLDSFKKLNLPILKETDGSDKE